MEEFQLQCLRCSIPQHIHGCDGLAQVLASMSILLAFVPVSNARGGTLPRGFASIGRPSVLFVCEADRWESAIELRRAHSTFAWSVTSSASRRRGRSRPGDAPPRRSSVQVAMAGGVPATLSCRCSWRGTNVAVQVDVGTWSATCVGRVVGDVVLDVRTEWNVRYLCFRLHVHVTFGFSRTLFLRTAFFLQRCANPRVHLSSSPKAKLRRKDHGLVSRAIALRGASAASTHVFAAYRIVSFVVVTHLDEVECSDSRRGTPTHGCFDVGDLRHFGFSHQFFPRQRHGFDAVPFPPATRARRAGACRTVRLMMRHKPLPHTVPTDHSQSRVHRLASGEAGEGGECPCFPGGSPPRIRANIS